MAGRHKLFDGLEGDDDRRSRRSRLTIAVIAALALLTATGVWWFSRGRSGSSLEPAAAVHHVVCTGPAVTVPVVLTPQLAPPVKRIAADWLATEPRAGGRCVRLQLTARTSDQAEAELARQAPAATGIWIPDSSVWVQRLRADRPAAGAEIQLRPSLASSPLVAVAAPRRAAVLAAGTGSADFDPLRQAILPDAGHNAEGLLSLLSQAGSAPATSGDLAGRRRSALANPAEGFDRLAASQAETMIFVASEQAVIAANRTAGGLIAVAVYPSQPTLGLDFPVVQLHGSAAAPGQAAAAAAFERVLRAPAARAQLAGAGLRAPDGAPLPGLGVASGALPDLVPAADPPTPQQCLAMWRQWQSAGS